MFAFDLRDGNAHDPGAMRANQQSNQLRIIGGIWRGRRVAFAPAAGLRPTPDRVRETLFNWLGSNVDGARCLDLFAGSGALGLEAASRGAAAVVLVDDDPLVVRTLQAQARTLDASQARIVQAESMRFLQGRGRILRYCLSRSPLSPGPASVMRAPARGAGVAGARRMGLSRGGTGNGSAAARKLATPSQQGGGAGGLSPGQAIGVNYTGNIAWAIIRTWISSSTPGPSIP